MKRTTDSIVIGQQASGVYAGITRDRDSGDDYHLFVGPELDIDGMSWQAAMQRAESLDYNGFTDWALPHRHEQALMFANVPELFQHEWYWSCEQHAGGSDDAWAQNFDDGLQDYWSKSGNALRARAVRRVPTLTKGA